MGHRKTRWLWSWMAVDLFISKSIQHIKHRKLWAGCRNIVTNASDKIHPLRVRARAAKAASKQESNRCW